MGLLGVVAEVEAGTVEVAYEGSGGDGVIVKAVVVVRAEVFVEG